jgi:hypothetical protein
VRNCVCETIVRRLLKQIPIDQPNLRLRGHRTWNGNNSKGAVKQTRIKRPREPYHTGTTNGHGFFEPLAFNLLSARFQSEHRNLAIGVRCIRVSVIHQPAAAQRTLGRAISHRS